MAFVISLATGAASFVSAKTGLQTSLMLPLVESAAVGLVELWHCLAKEVVVVVSTGADGEETDERLAVMPVPEEDEVWATGAAGGEALAIRLLPSVGGTVESWFHV